MSDKPLTEQDDLPPGYAIAADAVTIQQHYFVDPEGIMSGSTHGEEEDAVEAAWADYGRSSLATIADLRAKLADEQERRKEWAHGCANADLRAANAERERAAFVAKLDADGNVVSAMARLNDLLNREAEARALREAGQAVVDAAEERVIEGSHPRAARLMDALRLALRGKEADRA